MSLDGSKAVTNTSHKIAYTSCVSNSSIPRTKTFGWLLVSKMLGRTKLFGKILVTANQFPKNVGKVINRKSHVVSYRSAPPPHSKSTRIGAVLVGGAMWWWVIWHLWHEPDHITGEFDYPKPEKWSNYHLGVPRDN